MLKVTILSIDSLDDTEEGSWQRPETVEDALVHLLKQKIQDQTVRSAALKAQQLQKEATAKKEVLNRKTAFFR